MNHENKLYCSIAMGGWAEIGHTGEPSKSPNVNGDVYPCCPGWLKDDTNPAGYDFGNIYNAISWKSKGHNLNRICVYQEIFAMGSIYVIAYRFY